MVTISELRAEIEKEKRKQTYNQEIENIGGERAKLERELKELRFKNKYGKTQETGKKVWGEIKKGFGELQKGVGKLQENQNQRDKERRRGLFR
jgi:hypothetical protein